MGSEDREDDYSLSIGLKVMLAAAFSLFALVILVIIFHCYASHLRIRRSRHRRRRHSDQLVYQISAQIAPVDVEPRSPNHEHQGLDPLVIASLPKLSYKQTDQFSQGEAVECSVCLATILEDATIRVLPNCKHMFHADCVDTWFASNTTCPICRTVAEPLVQSGHSVVQPTAPPVV